MWNKDIDHRNSHYNFPCLLGHPVYIDLFVTVHPFTTMLKVNHENNVSEGFKS